MPHSGSLDMIKWYFKSNKNYKDIKVCCICRNRLKSISDDADIDYLFCKNCNNINEYKLLLMSSLYKCKQMYQIDKISYNEKKSLDQISIS